ncbi:MAG: heme lyase CcmF/NrfE family subunit [Gammaproteobacteria bacterium]
MIPELGHFALTLALSLAILQGVLPLIGAQRGLPGWMALARPAAYGQCIFTALAFGCLAVSFVSNDFSVLYVINNSNSALPTAYRIAAVWGAHEGSLLLWSLVLTLWMVAVAVFSRHLPDAFSARVLAVMGLINIAFLLFMLLTSNPFVRHFPAAADGRDLNPLLQDPGLVMHPPMLYMGYVGFSVAFSFAIAALLGGQLDAAWARWSRPWTLMAWVFLSIGITLGSWWAYYELGWGGWWFWDPVENASFMPWLVGTALIHSLAVTDKRAAFKRWTCLLAICAFSLSLLGTFLVRSGVLTSVHAFATDPERGVFILAILAVVVGGSLVLYALRAPRIKDIGRFDTLSREGLLMMNNVVLLAAAASVLLGTLYPLLLDALDLGKISVGPPYFNTVFAPLVLLLGMVLGLGPLTRWKQHTARELAHRLWPLTIGVLVAATLIILFLGGSHWVQAWAGTMVAIWIVVTSLLALGERLGRPRSISDLRRNLSRGFLGMLLGHLGLAVSIAGVTVTSLYGVERDVPLAVGESADLGDYRFRLERLEEVSGPNYHAVQGHVTVRRDEAVVTKLKPQKRIYRVQTSPMTEAGIDAGLTRDLFVALGEPLGDSKWSVRLQYKPLIRWVWLGGLLMALGGVLAASDRRYRIAAPPAPAAALDTVLAATTH